MKVKAIVFNRQSMMNAAGYLYLSCFSEFTLAKAISIWLKIKYCQRIFAH